MAAMGGRGGRGGGIGWGWGRGGYACVCPQVVECAAECGVLRALRIEHAPSPGVEVRYAASRGIAASAVLVGRCECL